MVTKSDPAALVDHARDQLYRIEAVIWAADVLHAERTDLLLSEAEYQSRVGHIIRIGLLMIEKLANEMDTRCIHEDRRS